jgi:predicted transport protein
MTKEALKGLMPADSLRVSGGLTSSYTKPERIRLTAHPDLSEKWVQSLIAADPSILGLGDLVLRDQERIQPRAGRLDLLLQDIETKRRYEVELQLGTTDEAHIIRTIEYWDIERKRYPQYDHCAVLIAEDVTSRFLNVISLFNGTVPLIAIQMQALKVGGHLTLVFTTVVDELSRGLVDEDEDAEAAPTDRAYWESLAAKATVASVDELLNVVHKFDPTLSLKYNKFYIGLAKDGAAFNFVSFRPKKNHMNLDLKLPRSEEVDARIEAGGLETLEYNKRWGQYRIRLSRDDVVKKQPILEELMKLAYDERTN